MEQVAANIINWALTTGNSGLVVALAFASYQTWELSRERRAREKADKEARDAAIPRTEALNALATAISEMKGVLYGLMSFPGGKR